MIFCGDMSVPNAECCRKLSDSMDKTGLFKDQTVVINLEGVLLEEQPNDCFWKVYNDKSVVDLKKHCRQLIFCLANNHMYDYPDQIGHMKQLLDDAGIQYFGLMEDDKIIPLEFEENGEMYAIFGHCWEIYTQTNRNTLTDDRVVDCGYEEFYKTVTTYIVDNPCRKVIVYFHWNFDMEEYPHPAYKQLAHDLIDFGVEAVIGNHAHCMHEVEIYRGKPIAYGEGNFYMPDGYFFNGALTHPQKSHSMYTLSVDNSSSGGGIQVCVFSTDVENSNAIILVNRKIPDLSETNTIIHIVCEYDSIRYKKFFVKNRVKRKFVPIFNDYYDSGINRMKTLFCIVRIRVIRAIKMYIDKRKA